MLRKILVAGLIGALVMIVWVMLVNGILGLESRVAMKTVPREAELHALLGAMIPGPGGYVINPAAGPEGFPPFEPVYSLRISGIGHGGAGRMMLTQLIRAFLVSLLAAWMFLHDSARARSGFWKRVGFFVLLGLFVALVSDLSQMGIGGFPAGAVLLLAARDFLAWLFVGLALAAWLKPAKARA